MTYIVPNYFQENDYPNLIKIDNLLCLNYITKYKNDPVFARTTMHSMGILLEGSKDIHLDNQDITINKGEISFLTQNNYYMSERTTLNSNYKSLIVYFDDKWKQKIVYDKTTRRVLGAQMASKQDISMGIHMFSLAIQEKVSIDKLKLLDIFFLK